MSKPTYEELKEKCAFLESKQKAISMVIEGIETMCDVAIVAAKAPEDRHAVIMAENEQLRQRVAEMEAEHVEMEKKVDIYVVECMAANLAIAFLRAGRTDVEHNTPSTNRYLANVRAKAIEACADELITQGDIGDRAHDAMYAHAQALRDEIPFSFDMEAIQASIDSGFVPVPDVDSFDAFNKAMKEAAAPTQDGANKIEVLSTICGETYQVVGVMADALGIFETPQIQKVLDNLSRQQLLHSDILPFGIPEVSQ